MVFISLSLAASSLTLKGQTSLWIQTAYDTSPGATVGAYYIPSLTARFGSLDAEISAHSLASGTLRPATGIAGAIKVKPYRIWTRFSSARAEIRAGLQQVNFGSATLLRPLQWFDRLDPRDPLSLTDGVYGLLGRYWFQNNANIWVWGLIGNSVTKGWETVPSPRWSPELGGRFQLPIPKGEAAASYHRRRTVRNNEQIPEQAEDRLGFDAKLDIGPGLWFEGTLSRIGGCETSGNPFWQQRTTIGTDYTFGLGNGLLVIAEHMTVNSGAKPFQFIQTSHISAVLASYPLGLVDNLRGMLFFDWTSGQPYAYSGWQRTLDRWIINLAVFWGQTRQVVLARVTNTVPTKSMRLSVVFYH